MKGKGGTQEGKESSKELTLKVCKKRKGIRQESMQK